MQPNTAVCRNGSGDSCDPDELCTGSAGVACPGDTITSAGTVCNAGSGDLCDTDETCSGSAGTACPADSFEPTTTLCNPGSGDLCDVDEFCPGAADGACPSDTVASFGHGPAAPAPVTFVIPMRPASGLADDPCTADIVLSAGTVCNAGSGDLCDHDETCSGSAGVACPADSVEPATTVCRAVFGYAERRPRV